MFPIANENIFYKVSISELNEEIIIKARKFAEEVVSETYDRFSYSFDRRVEVVFIGKISEEVFAKFIKENFNILLDVNYEIYPGVFNSDANDFVLNDLEIDIKSSKDTKNEGIDSCYSYFNFPVPVDQKIKDITVSILYDYEIKNFYIASWIDKETYRKNHTIKRINIGNNIYKEFYLCPLREGKSIKDFKSIMAKST